MSGSGKGVLPVDEESWDDYELRLHPSPGPLTEEQKEFIRRVADEKIQEFEQETESRQHSLGAEPPRPPVSQKDILKAKAFMELAQWGLDHGMVELSAWGIGLRIAEGAAVAQYQRWVGDLNKPQGPKDEPKPQHRRNPYAMPRKE